MAAILSSLLRLWASMLACDATPDRCSVPELRFQNEKRLPRFVPWLDPDGDELASPLPAAPKSFARDDVPRSVLPAALWCDTVDDTPISPLPAALSYADLDDALDSPLPAAPLDDEIVAAALPHDLVELSSPRLAAPLKDSYDDFSQPTHADPLQVVYSGVVDRRGASGSFAFVSSEAFAQAHGQRAFLPEWFAKDWPSRSEVNFRVRANRQGRIQVCWIQGCGDGALLRPSPCPTVAPPTQPQTDFAALLSEAASKKVALVKCIDNYRQQTIANWLRWCSFAVDRGYPKGRPLNRIPLDALEAFADGHAITFQDQDSFRKDTRLFNAKGYRIKNDSLKDTKLFNAKGNHIKNNDSGSRCSDGRRP